MFLWCAAISVHPATATVVVTSKGGHQKCEDLKEGDKVEAVIKATEILILKE
jgi:molybdopterin-binding protein